MTDVTKIGNLRDCLPMKIQEAIYREIMRRFDAAMLGGKLGSLLDAAYVGGIIALKIQLDQELSNGLGG